MLYLKGKLTDEQAEALADFVDTEAFVVLTQIVLPQLIEARAERVLTQTVAEQQDLLKLALTRSELDGAKRLAMDIGKLKEHAKKATSAPIRRK